LSNVTTSEHDGFLVRMIRLSTHSLQIEGPTLFPVFASVAGSLLRQADLLLWDLNTNLANSLSLMVLGHGDQLRARTDNGYGDEGP
jgi:hypothetical protein